MRIKVYSPYPLKEYKNGSICLKAVTNKPIKIAPNSTEVIKTEVIFSVEDTSAPYFMAVGNFPNLILKDLQLVPMHDNLQEVKGGICVLLRNMSPKQPATIENGDTVASLAFHTCDTYSFVHVSSEEELERKVPQKTLSSTPTIEAKPAPVKVEAPKEVVEGNVRDEFIDDTPADASSLTVLKQEDVVVTEEDLALEQKLIAQEAKKTKPMAAVQNKAPVSTTTWKGNMNKNERFKAFREWALKHTQAGNRFTVFIDMQGKQQTFKLAGAHEGDGNPHRIVFEAKDEDFMQVQPAHLNGIYFNPAPTKGQNLSVVNKVQLKGKFGNMVVQLRNVPRNV